MPGVLNIDIAFTQDSKLDAHANVMNQRNEQGQHVLQQARLNIKDLEFRSRTCALEAD